MQLIVIGDYEKGTNAIFCSYRVAGASFFYFVIARSNDVRFVAISCYSVPLHRISLPPFSDATGLTGVL